MLGFGQLFVRIKMYMDLLASAVVQISKNELDLH